MWMASLLDESDACRTKECCVTLSSRPCWSEDRPQGAQLVSFEAQCVAETHLGRLWAAMKPVGLLGN